MTQRENAFFNYEIERCLSATEGVRSEKNPETLKALRRVFLKLEKYSESPLGAAQLLRERCISLDGCHNMRPYAMFGSLWHSFRKHGKALCQKYRSIDDSAMNCFIESLEKIHGTFAEEQMRQRWI